MSDVKWIKITTNIFDDEKIKIIDTMPARDEILVVWFKLLALAGKTNQSGMLFMSNKIAYTPEMLSAVFNRELNVVKLSLKTFETYGMIEVEENEVITIVNWEKHQNVDGLEKMRLQTAERVKRHRDSKNKLLLESSNAKCNVTVTLCNALEEELEIDKEIDKDNTIIIVNSIESPTPTFKFANQFSSAEFRATKYLIDLMVKNNPKVKVPKPETKQFEVWCESMDKLHRIDKMSWDDIKAIVDFSQNDQFWQSNILSTSKLREKKDTLILQLSRYKPKDTFGRQMEEMKGWDLG